MPQDASQLDPNFDYAKLPDGTFAKFPKGTSPDVMKSKLTAAGFLKTPTAAKQQPYGSQAAYLKSMQPASAMSGAKQAVKTALPYVTEPAKGIASTLKSMVTYPWDAAQKRPGDEKMGFWSNVPSMRMVEHSYDDFFRQTHEAARAREAAAKGGEGLIGQTMASAEKMPIIGPMVERAEKGAVTAGPGMSLQTHYFTPQQLRATAEAVTMAKGPELIVDKATGMLDSEALRNRAAKLNTKVLKVAKGNVKGYNMATGLQVAKEGIYGTLKNLPEKIEAKRLAKDAAAQSLAKQLDAQGTTVDISQQITPVMQRITQTANAQGMLTPRVVEQLRGLVKRVTTERDMQTGAVRPRNLTNLTISQALQLQRGLNDLSEFGKNAPDVVTKAARDLNQVIHNAVASKSPELLKLNKEQSMLIQARDAARDNYAKALNEGRTTARGFIYSNMPAIAVYLGLKAMGMSFGPAIGGIVVMRTLAESATSRTLRAALYAKAADMLDAATARLQAPQGPNNAGGPGSAITGPRGPQVPPQQQLTSAAGPGAPPVAPAQVVYTNPPNEPSWRGPAAPQRLPAKATRARAGSGDYVTPERMEAAKHGGPQQASPMADALRDIDRRVVQHIERTDATRAEIKKGQSGAKSNTKSVPQSSREAGGSGTAAGAQRDTTALQQIQKEHPDWTLSQQLQEAAKRVNPSASVATKTEPQAFHKAMMDRLDNLLERQANPKSGADRVAIEREITEIKRVLSGEAKGSETSAINKRIADRERLASKRATAKAEGPGSSTGSHTGSTADPAARADASPENRAMLLDLGYKQLAKLAGPEAVKALQKLAKDLQGTDYDEVTQLADAIRAMKEVGYDDSLTSGGGNK